MRLPDFVAANTERIVAEWESFARTVWPEGATAQPSELRDEAAEILLATVADMRSAQSAGQQAEKSKGIPKPSPTSNELTRVSSSHGVGRAVSGFDLAGVIAEYRALRASALRLWRDSGPSPDSNDLDDVTRFNESMDQSLTEAVQSFAKRIEHEREALLIADMNRRRSAEEALRASEEQFRRSIEEAPIPVIMHAEDGQVLQVSRTWTELTGYTPDEIPTFEAWLTGAYGHGADAVREHVHALFSGAPRRLSIDFPVRTRAGELRHWSFSASAPGILRDGRRFVVGMALDVTERPVAEEALRASEEHLRAVIDSLQDYAIITLDPEGRITSWNDGARRMSGFSAEEVVGGMIDRFYPDDDVSAGKPARELARAIETGRSEDESWRVRKDGSRFWVNEIVRPLRSSEGRVNGFAKISRDLTERKTFEEALQQAHDLLEARVRDRTAEVQALFTRLVSAQEEERRRMARDIHDQLGQQITAVRMHLDVLAGHLHQNLSVASQAIRTQRLAEELDRSIDFLTWDLRPAALDHLGLAAALDTLCTGWSQRFGISVDVDVEDVEGLRLSHDKEANLYRLAQEALHNVLKHARATHVSVLLHRRGDGLRFVLEDNGCGFVLEEARPRPGSSSLGLVSMSERAALIGGHFTIKSEPGRGTTVFVSVPLCVGDEKPA